MNYVSSIIGIDSIIAIFYTGSLMGALMKLIYVNLGINVDIPMGVHSGLAILILIFVLYRNRLQFSGFYKGDKD